VKWSSPIMKGKFFAIASLREKMEPPAKTENRNTRISANSPPEKISALPV
jgi:hypothetical protein